MKIIASLILLLVMFPFMSAANSAIFEVDVDEVYTFEKRNTHEGRYTCAVPSRITARTPRVCCLDDQFTLNVEYSYWDASDSIHPIPYCRNTEENQPVTGYGEE